MDCDSPVDNKSKSESKISLVKKIMNGTSAMKNRNDSNKGPDVQNNQKRGVISKNKVVKEEEDNDSE